GELLKLGIKISQATVGRWMPWRPKIPSPTRAICCEIGTNRMVRPSAIAFARWASRRSSLLVAFLSELHALGIDLFLHQQGLHTTTPAGKAMFQMFGVFAEFEHKAAKVSGLEVPPMCSGAPTR